MTISRIPDRQATKSRIPYPNLVNPASLVAVKSRIPSRCFAFSRILHRILVKSQIPRIPFQTLFQLLALRMFLRVNRKNIALSLPPACVFLRRKNFLRHFLRVHYFWVVLYYSAECYLRVFFSFNLQYLSYERRRVVWGFLYLCCKTHAQLSKAANRMECGIGCVV